MTVIFCIFRWAVDQSRGILQVIACMAIVVCLVEVAAWVDALIRYDSIEQFLRYEGRHLEAGSGLLLLTPTVVGACLALLLLALLDPFPLPRYMFCLLPVVFLLWKVFNFVVWFALRYFLVLSIFTVPFVLLTLFAVDWEPFTAPLMSLLFLVLTSSACIAVAWIIMTRKERSVGLFDEWYDWDWEWQDEW
ncbi:MAG: hypothetical protein F4213_03260 [Boseongicola sp. SB0677_bin_26]|nr:hypothetical protein [Boseongicola sp. SB0665_bin_10]MYG25033.1 hypothetical protein [Boseongicola sp. SB0677_bin_26]